MHNRLYPVILGMALSTGTALLVTGCNREDTVSTGASAPSQSAAMPPTATVGTLNDDAVVTTNVKSALLGDQDMKGFDITVQNHKGAVLLNGIVDNQAQADRAVTIARAVDGVRDVASDLSIRK